jgi:hypothetical protein
MGHPGILESEIKIASLLGDVENHGMQEEMDSHKRLPLVVSLIGILLIVGSLVLAGRLIWEMTWLTWHQGPQMIGFSLAHGGYGVIFLFPILLCAWILVVGVMLIVSKLKGRIIAKQTWPIIGCALATLGLLSIPQSFWNMVFVGRLAQSPRASTLLVYSAGSGERHVVNDLLKRGVSVNATDREGSTALHFAAGAGQTEIVSDLLDHGADVNVVNLWGDSPLHIAQANHHASAAQVLSAHGAKDVSGDEEQRKRAAHDIVQQDIERMNEHPR